MTERKGNTGFMDYVSVATVNVPLMEDGRISPINRTNNGNKAVKIHIAFLTDGNMNMSLRDATLIYRSVLKW